jgi:PAS domain S-box-containing protein
MKDTFESVLAELRARVEHGKTRETLVDGDALARALHELDVHRAELEIQNQDLRETQQELTRSYENYKRLFDESPLGLLQMDSTGLVQAANEAAAKLLGRAPARIVGKPIVVFLAEGESSSYFAHARSVIASAAPENVELTFRAAGGQERLLSIRSAALSSAPVTLISYVVDVTEQRAAEQAQRELLARQGEAEKLEAIGRVAANIAHDVNNILVSVISLAEFAKSQAPGAREDLDALTDAAWRGARLMRGLLGLSRGTTGSPRVFDLGALVARVAEMLKRSKPEVIVVAEVCQDPLGIAGNEEELVQALLNLGTNGLDAMERGTLTFRCKPLEDAALIEVTDEGIGIEPGMEKRVFEPLYTTKAAQGGSGLGLTIVEKTVRGLGGSIWLESAPGRGTTVRVQLPVRPFSLAPEPRGSAEGVLTARVLLVDDDDQVRYATKRALESWGAGVVEFANPLDALSAATAGTPFDVALLDVNMPELSGPELASRLRERLGSVPVVLVTGASGELIPQSEAAREDVRVLRKPWSRNELIGALNAVIGS